MRVFHTADWHLGQDFHGFDRTHEHRSFLGWLAQTLETQQADALVVAGDVFDGQNPSAAAQRLLYEFVVDVKRRLPDLDIVIVGGNHDSAGRLEAPGPLLSVLGVHVVGSLPRDKNGSIDPDRLLIPLRNRGGEPAVLCCAVPFLRAADLPPADSNTTTDPLIDGVRRIYADALALAAERRHGGQALLLTGHCYMTGGSLSELSERRILGGNQHALPVDVFGDTASYVALGHLHKPQRVGGVEHIRYAGSPFPMAVNERHYQHQVLQLDFDGPTHPTVTSIRIPRPVALLRVPESGVAPLVEVLDRLAGLSLTKVEREQQPYLEIAVTVDGPAPGLVRDINAALEGVPVRLVRVDRQMAAVTDDVEAPLPELSDLHPEDVFRQCWTRRFAGEPDGVALAAFRHLVETVEQTDKR